MAFHCFSPYGIKDCYMSDRHHNIIDKLDQLKPDILREKLINKPI